MYTAGKAPSFQHSERHGIAMEPTGLTQRAPMDLCRCCTAGCTESRLQGLRVDVTRIIKKICFVGRLQ